MFELFVRASREVEGDLFCVPCCRLKGHPFSEHLEHKESRRCKSSLKPRRLRACHDVNQRKSQKSVTVSGW